MLQIHIPQRKSNEKFDLWFSGNMQSAICTTRPYQGVPGVDRPWGKRGTTRRRKTETKASASENSLGNFIHMPSTHKTAQNCHVSVETGKGHSQLSLSLSPSLYVYLSLNTQKSESFWHSTMNAICKICWGVEAASPTKYANFVHTHKAKEMTGNNFREMQLSL